MNKCDRAKLLDISALLKNSTSHNDSICTENIVWQQMKFEYFCNLLHNKKLCFKQLSKYDSSYERKLSYYEQCYLTGIAKKDEIIRDMIRNFEQIVYISCWFSEENLQDVLFKEYAGNGVAIGVSIKNLLKAFNKLNDAILSPYEEMYCGKVIYIENDDKDVVDSQEAIAPLFLKNNSYMCDHEFRVVCIRDSLWKSDLNKMYLPGDIGEYLFLNIGAIVDFIDYIAIRENDINNMCFNHALQYNHLNIKRSKKTMDGFLIYEFEKQRRNNNVRNKRLVQREI